MPVYGTCAGLILLADRITDGIEGQQTFGGLDVDGARATPSAARSTRSRPTSTSPALGEPPVHAVFIRAPLVESRRRRRRALAALADGRVVAVRQGNLLGTSFHPEVTGEHRFHELLPRHVRAA